MRVGLIAMQANPIAADAAEQHRPVAGLASALAREGHEVRVYTRTDAADTRMRATTMPDTSVPDATLPSISLPAGVTVEKGPVPTQTPARVSHAEFGAWLRERWQGGNWRPEVVHAHFWLSGLAAVPAAREHGIPIVQTFGSLGSSRRRWYGRTDPVARERIRLERGLARDADRVVAHSHGEATELARLGVDRKNISVIPVGVDTEVFTPKGEAEPPNAGRRRILSVGVPGPGTGFDEIITALSWVPGAELVIAGGPPAGRVESDVSTGRLRRTAESTGVADRVRFVGAVPARELPRWYRSATIYASAASDGSFGLPAVEAMACGAPVVAYGSGGLLDSVVHRVTGVLVAPHDVRAFALTLRRLLVSDFDRFAYADAGVDRIHARYDWRRIVIDVTRVYQDLRE